MAKKIGKRTIKVFRITKQDRLNTGAEPAEPTHEVKFCAVLPRSSFEQGKGWVTVEGYQVIAPYGADVLAADQVDIGDGTKWDVEGNPGDYEDRRMKGKATMFYLKKVGKA